MYSDSFMFSFKFIFIVSCLRNPSLSQSHKNVLLKFQKKNELRIWVLIQTIFVYGLRYVSMFSWSSSRKDYRESEKKSLEKQWMEFFWN